MGTPKINRVGEKRLNNFGSEMIIIEYRNTKDIDIYFPEYNWTAKNMAYSSFKKGQIKCPFEPKVCNKGYLGEGKYKAKVNGKNTKYYKIWQDMLARCYNIKTQIRRSTYKECEVCDEWLNFQNFCKWYEENYYEVKNENICLDKDILIHNNKVYSPNTCLIVPQRINTLFVKCNKRRGKYPIGISETPAGNYKVKCSDGYGNQVYLGTYETIEEAFKVYKEFKERVIKQVADEYYSKGLIPKKVYDAMYSYEVLISD